MRILIEIDTKAKISRIIQTTELTVDDIFRIVCDYFSVPKESLLSRPLRKYDYYKLCRKFIAYFLDSELSIVHKSIAKLLNYEEGEENGSTGIVSYLLSSLNRELEKENNKYTRPYNNLLKLISKFNLEKLDNNE
jgi:hypothetical protein